MYGIYPVLSQDGSILRISGLQVEIGITTTKFGSVTSNIFNNGNQMLNEIKQTFSVQNVILMKPEHGVNVKTIPLPPKEIKPYECDGLVFDVDDFPNKKEKDTLIGMPLGNCPGIWYISSSIFAINHSGRETTFENIIKRTVRYLNDIYYLRPHQYTVVVWPGICYKCYTLPLNFKKQFPKPGHYVNGGLDFARILEDQLLDSLVPERNIITLKNLCSHCSYNSGSPIFYSHRRGDPERVLAYMIV